MNTIRPADFRTGRHVVYNLHAHIVLVPKYRKKVMTPRVIAKDNHLVIGDLDPALTDGDCGRALFNNLPSYQSFCSFGCQPIQQCLQGLWISGVAQHTNYRVYAYRLIDSS